MSNVAFMDGVISFPSDMSIFSCKKVYEELKALQIDKLSSVSIDLSDVDELDGAGLQLLLVYTNNLIKDGLEVSFSEPSDQINQLLSYASFFDAVAQMEKL